MQKIKSTNKLLFTITIIAYLIALIIYGHWNYQYHKNEIVDNIDRELYNYATTLKYILPEDFHDRAIDRQAISIEEDRYITTKLTKLVNETSLKYTYTIIKKGNHLFFVVSDIIADPETKRGTFYFYPYEEADESFINAFDKEEPTYKTVSDQWGTVRTVMVPEESPGGVKYLACADYDISYVNRVLQRNLLRSIVTILFFLLLAAPILLIYWKFRRKYIDSLRESEEKYKSLTNNINVGIYRNTAGSKGKVIEANPAIVEMFGFNRREDFLEVIVSDLYKNPYGRDEFSAKILKEGAVRNEEFQFQKRDGTVFTGSVSAVIVKGEKGEVKYFDGIIEDITAQKRAEKTLRESEEKLVRSKKMESLGLLAGGVAHDLNNVLAGIVSYPELLLLDLSEDSKLRKPIETMREAGYRAAAIVQDLLTVARGVATTKEALNLNDLISDYLNSPEFEKLKQFHPTVTIKTIPGTELFSICGSYVHIRKVVMNLVSNAAEAIEGNGDVTISTMNRYVDRPLRGYDDVTTGEYVVLAVSDDGSGISSDDRERIFEPFYTKKVMGKSGTGLGLAVVWNVVQDHKGYINVTSGENGTTFDLYFPITREGISGRDLALPIEDFKGAGETILVVDDVESQREIAGYILDRLGYKARAVSSGEEAIEYLTEHTVDLVLLDMIMDPGINGLKTYEQIIKIHPNQKAIIVSGFAETDDVKEALKLGAGKYIKKPITLERLGLTIREELDK